jgi:hypothetical protein
MTPHSFRRTAALGLTGGPLLFTLGDLLRRLVEPYGNPSATQLTQAVGDHPVTWLSAGLLSVLAAPLILVGVAGLLVDAVGRGARTTVAGVALVAVGACASVGHAAAFYAPYALYDRAGTPHTALRALDDTSGSYPLLVCLITAFVVGMMLGSIVLFVGPRRARRVPLWAVISAVVFVAAGSSGGVVAGVVGVLAAGVAFGAAAGSLTRSAPPAAAVPERREANLPV